jgi:membrane protein DedA with SNARE-associated domain
MEWFGIAAVTGGVIVALVLLTLGILVVRQWWREDDVVEMPGGETIFDTPPRRKWSAPPRRPLD